VHLHPGVARAYAVGAAVAPLLPVMWERHWDEPLTEVRRRYRVTPYPR